LSRVAERSPAVDTAAGAQQVAAERQPVRAVHQRIGTLQATQQAGVQVVEADGVLAGVLQSHGQHRGPAGPEVGEVAPAEPAPRPRPAPARSPAGAPRPGAEYSARAAA